MKFGPVPVDDALGKRLGHNIADGDGRRRLRKGRPLDASDLDTLRALGRRSVYVAELERGDIDENAAALAVARACCGQGLRLSSASTGRVNIVATTRGVVHVREAELREIHQSDGVTVASVAPHHVARAGQTVATVKVIPYALHDDVVSRAVAAATPSPLSLVELGARRVGLVLSGSASVRDALTEGFSPLTERVASLGSDVCWREFVDLADEAGEGELAASLRRASSEGMELILLAGETAIMDRHDITPRAVERAGGRVETVGAPVDPGNLLMLAYLGDVPVLGVPGCARSRKTNVVDWVLPRLLSGERLVRDDIVALAVGGLLEDVPERPLPRSRVV